MKVVRNPTAWVSPRAYVPALLIDGWCYLSGHVPVDATGATVGEEAQQQTEVILLNLERVLEQAGGSRASLVSTTVYLTDIADMDRVDRAYRHFFVDGNYPTRTTMQIAALGRPEFLVEISAVARLDDTVASA